MYYQLDVLKEQKAIDWFPITVLHILLGYITDEFRCKYLS